MQDHHHKSVQESLTDKAYRLIEEAIVSLDLAPGLALSEASLEQRTEIGRTPVREALHRLARGGLVTISPRRGIYVTEIRVDAQLRLLEVRRGLERLMASRAARLATPDERQEFKQIAAAMHMSGKNADDVAFLKHDRLFNQRVAAVSANEFAEAAIGVTAGLSRRFWYRYYKTHADLSITAYLHEGVAQAIGNGDLPGAATASDILMDYIEQFTRKIFDYLV